MVPDASQSNHPTPTNPDELSRLLEIELIQKRMEWQLASARHKNMRSVSLALLLLIVIAGLAAFVFAFMRASEQRQQHPPNSPTAPAQP